ncbi:MAG TPA: hypothetical protein VHV51_00260 [Polyangiaceae bacterium]|jgi:hypothetical protein|nr:hypothetical protein [Polyangiaceae bacterium]
MDCAEIREALLRGEAEPSAEIEAHLASCTHCRELFAKEAELGRSLASASSLPLTLADDSFAQIETRVAEESGLRAWLRSRPSKIRFLLAALSVLAAVIVGAVLHPRRDLGDYPEARLSLLLGLYALGIALAFGKELFLSVRRGSFADFGWLVAAALALPFLVAFAPPTLASQSFGPEGAFACFRYGALLTLPTAALLWAFDRDDRLSLRTVCLSAAALGLAASLILELHCPSGNLVHVLFGHASIGLAWLALWAFVRRANRAAS